MYVIKDSCSGCHTCELACPMQAIHYNGPKYEIDPEVCVECGLCETLCPTCSIYDADEVKKPEPHERIVRECDIVVCGGGSGLVAAVKAAQLGKKVILLEKASRVGGNTDLAHGFFPVYSKMHEELGVEDVREEAIEVLFDRAGGVIEKDVLRTAVYGCTEFFDWLLEFPETREVYAVEPLGDKREAGPIFGPAVTHFIRRIENTRSLDPSIGPGWAGTYVKNTMLSAIPEQKLDVEILLNHEAKHLVTDESGAVTGVVALDPGGETEIRCKAVILATGGFGSSDEKLQRFANFFDVERPVTRFSVPSDTGDAIDMLEELGVEPNPERMFVSFFGPAHHPYSYCLYRLIEEPTNLSVDLNGDRWQDESGGLFTGRINIQGHPCECTWNIFTQQNVDSIFQKFLRDPALTDEIECYEHYQEDLDRETTYKVPAVVKADTVGQLAEKLGMDPDKLCRTISEYNRFCREGKDEQFHKDAQYLIPREAGPYYAVYAQRFSEAAMGGLMVDADCHVLRNDGTPIPGLFGVGDATSAMHRKGELAVVSELTWAVASAYRSAVNAVQEMEVEA
ncbi:MAG: FAD-dependent oxidoreductase [Oscillospiraceae bacterium]